MVGTQRTSWTFFSNLLIVALGVLVVGFVLVLGFGSVTGSQICPQTFEMRSYDYYRIPWTQIQITPVKYTKITNLLVADLNDSELLPSTAVTRWDEVVFQAVGVSEQRGRAWVLASALTMTDHQGSNHWLLWSGDHPRIAEELWNYVSIAAVDGVYFVIPDLLESAARQAHDEGIAAGQQLVSAEFQRILTAGYQQQIAAHKASGADEQASALQASLARLELIESPP